MLLLLLTQGGDPPPRSPEALLLFGARIHLHASEELDSDHLRSLARKNVALWLSTRSNSLSASTLETINRFPEAWIALRAPVRESDAQQLSKVPRAGVWIDANDLDGARRALGPRRLAVRLKGPLEPGLAERLRKLHPSETSWTAPGDVDLLSWGLFRQLPGRKFLRRAPAEIWPVKCADGPSASEPTMELGLQTLLEVRDGAFPCGKGPRIEVPIPTDRSILSRVLLREPSAELVVDVGEDPQKASKARRFFDDLGLK